LPAIGSGRLKCEVVADIVAVGVNPVAQAAGLRRRQLQVIIHDSLDRGIAGGRKLPDARRQCRILRTGKIKEVDTSYLRTIAISEDALRRFRSENSCRHPVTLGQPKPFVIDEEERAVPHKGSAKMNAALIENQLIARKAIAIVEVVICIQGRV